MDRFLYGVGQTGGQVVKQCNHLTRAGRSFHSHFSGRLTLLYLIIAKAGWARRRGITGWYCEKLAIIRAACMVLVLFVLNQAGIKKH